MLGVVTVLLAVSGFSNAASANKIVNGKWVTVYLPGGGDKFDNWDYLNRCQPHTFYKVSDGCQTRKSTQVDAPIDLIFTNNAEVDKVKYHAGSKFPSDVASLKNAIVGPSWGWDEDRGRKMHEGNGSPCYTTNYHFRIYADGNDDRLYNVNYGYFVIASSHNDYRESCSGSHTDFTESSEKAIARWYYSVGATGNLDKWNLYNAQNNVQGKNVFRSNGYASQVTIPSSW